MTSKITIEIDFDTACPYIRVMNDRMSDDVRDKLITHFRHKLGHSSSWCRVIFDDAGLNGVPYFMIQPIPPHLLSEELRLMRDTVEYMDKNPQQNPQTTD